MGFFYLCFLVFVAYDVAFWRRAVVWHVREGRWNDGILFSRNALDSPIMIYCSRTLSFGYLVHGRDVYDCNLWILGTLWRNRATQGHMLSSACRLLKDVAGSFIKRLAGQRDAGLTDVDMTLIRLAAFVLQCYAGICRMGYTA